MRSLSPEEAAAWARVASTIRPLSRNANDRDSIEPATGPSLTSKAASGALRSSVPKRQERRGPGTTLDASWDRRLSDGTIEPDRTVDLHGMSLDGAWRTIDGALDRSIARGDRLLLLITGHERPGHLPLRRGAIRAAVHDWLAASRHARDIAAVRPAHGRHGGRGSLYIVLRRKGRGR